VPALGATGGLLAGAHLSPRVYFTGGVVMKRATIMGGWVLAIGFFLGCTPSPEKVCGKMFDLLEAEGKKSKSKDKDDDASDMMKKMKEKCVKDAEKEKEEDPESYKCGAKCIMDSKDLEDAMKCEKSCPKKKDKAKKSGDDDDDKKSKKKGDDDDDDKPAKKKKKSDD
jgi:hypothetical protein